MSFFSYFSKIKNKQLFSTDSLPLDILSGDFFNDPYPALKYLRQNDPLHRGKNGSWLLTRYDDVQQALANKELGNAPSLYAVVHYKNSEKYSCADVANNILPFIDPPEHTVKRDIISKSFFHIVKQFLNDDDAQHIAYRIAGNCKKETVFDVIHDFGTPFSTEIMCRLIGFPVEDKLKLAYWSELFLYLFSSIPDNKTLDKVNSALDAFRQYTITQISKKSIASGGNWAGSLITYNSTNSSPLNENEIIDNIMLLFVDGVENVDRMLGTCIKLLHDHPEQREQLINDLTKLDSFIDECLRYESPVQFISRIARDNLVIHDQLIRKDSAVLLMLGSANRDDAKFSDPDSFQYERDNRATLTFGRGTHTCLGRTLVRHQLKTALLVLLEYFPDFSLADKTPYWEKRLAHRWLKSMKIKHN
ncbi:MAG: cytochrome P450 [Gammaproteobacteria bacterium]